MIERNLIRDNALHIIGTLVDVNLREDQSKAGKDYIRGKISVKTNSQVIELNLFTMKLTKGGEVSKLYNTYATLDSLKNRRVSVEGYIDEASIPAGNEVRKGNSLYARFISPLAANDTREDSATFEVSGFIKEGLKAIYASDGATIKDYELRLAQSNYQKTAALEFRFNVNKENQNAIDSLNEKFTVNTSCTLSGVLDFDVENVTTTIANDFGPSTTNTYQVSTRRYVIVSGSLVADESAYTQEEIDELLEGSRKKDLETLNARSTTSDTTTRISNVKPSSAQPKLI